MGIGLVLFWPSLLLLEGGDGPEAAEYAQLKGEFEALRTNTVQRKCGIEAKSPEQIMKEADEAAKVEEKNHNKANPADPKNAACFSVG